MTPVDKSAETPRDADPVAPIPAKKADAKKVTAKKAVPVKAKRKTEAASAALVESAVVTPESPKTVKKAAKKVTTVAEKQSEATPPSKPKAKGGKAVPPAGADIAPIVAESAMEAPIKAKRAKKEKVVRDSFTMPKSEYATLATLKQQCLDAGVAAKKSELLRAGLAVLAALPAAKLVEAVKALEAVKTGRPSQTA